tara:strand:+ start:718 stop:990 length:273 start_codon:yes stop_codon:yes gene_type:complete
MATKREVPWRTSRRIVLSTLLVCAGVVGRFTFWDGTDTRVNEALVTGAYMLAAAVIGSYVFGKTWETINVPTSPRRRSYEESASGYDYGG